MRFTHSIGHGIGRATMDAHQASDKRRPQHVRQPAVPQAGVCSGVAGAEQAVAAVRGVESVVIAVGAGNGHGAAVIETERGEDTGSQRAILAALLIKTATTARLPSAYRRFIP